MGPEVRSRLQAVADQDDGVAALPSGVPELRHAIYTTNTIEALNRILRKTLKTRGPLPTDEAALKLLYLAIRNAKATWGRGHRDWLTARLQLNIHFEGRLPSM